MPIKKKKTLTIRQQKLIRLITENLGKEEGCKTLYEMMLEAGLSENSARQQSNIMAGIKDEFEPIVEKMIAERTRAIEAMAGKLSEAKYRDLTDAQDKLTKNIQLLSGKETEKKLTVVVAQYGK